MSRTKNPFPTTWSLKDLLKHLGNIAPERIRLKPPPGLATEKDVLKIEQQEERLYELVDGVLVEKVMGFQESSLTMWLGHLLETYLEKHERGFLAGPDGTVRLLPGLVRIPDISFVSWDQLPDRAIPNDPIPDLAPILVIEVLSKGNTKKEMKRKLKDYFFSGVQIVWFVDPDQRTVEVFTAPDQSSLLAEEDTLTGGEVLPKFKLPLKRLFSRLQVPTDKGQRQAAKTRSNKK